MKGNSTSSVYNEKGESPLRDIRGVLKGFNLACGFPLTVSAEDDTKLAFSRKEYAKLFVFLVLAGVAATAFAFYVAAMAPGGFDFGFFLHILYKKGFKVMDFATTYAGTMIFMTSVIIMFTRWIAAEKSLSRLCKSIKDLSTSSTLSGLAQEAGGAPIGRSGRSSS